MPAMRLNVTLRLFLLAATISTIAMGAAVSSADAGIRGTFTTHLSGASPTFLNGGWQVEFGARGHLTIRHNNELAARGTYLVLAKGRLRIEDHSGPLACTTPQDHGPATYHWRLSARKLILTAIHDRCGGRETVLTARPLAGT
jgi:hypothetical protein